MSDWAGVGLLSVQEVCRTWTYYSAEANTQMGRRMHQNTHFETEKWRWGAFAPKPKSWIRPCRMQTTKSWSHIIPISCRNYTIII